MTIHEILKEWEKDSVIDDSMLDKESLRIIQLHAKYLTFLAITKKRVRGLYAKKKYKTKHLTSYYRGEYNENSKALEHLGKQALRSKIMKSDVSFKVDHDESMISLVLELDKEVLKGQVLDEIMKSLYARNFNIKNAVDWQKVLGGG